ncbi:MAG: hypothetical protein ACJ8AC_14310 [Gemmatimonadaceae bacterium]
MRMRLVILCLIIPIVTACETSTDAIIGFPDGGGGAITAVQASGNWSITLQRTTNLPCTGALASGQVINAHLDVLSDGTVSSSTSTWVNPISGAPQSLSGAITLSNGVTDLRFVGSGSAAMELFPGTMTAAGSITGATITDPGAGSSQLFGTNGCQYTATAIKTS